MKYAALLLLSLCACAHHALVTPTSVDVRVLAPIAYDSYDTYPVKHWKHCRAGYDRVWGVVNGSRVDERCIRPHVEPDGLQAFIVRTHHCKLTRTEPAYSRIFPSHHTNQLWTCAGPDMQFWILADYEQPKEGK